MSIIKVYRKNELLNKKRRISFFVNNSEYKIKSNDFIELDLKSGYYSFYTKIDWIKSKVIKVDIKENKTYSIRIKPFISNNYLYLIASILPIINIFFYKLNSIIFWLINIIIILYFIYFIYHFTIGRNRYLSLIIKEINVV